MKSKHLEKILLMFLLGLALVSLPAGATTHERRRDCYPAHVIVQGNMTLIGDSGSFDITGIEANFTAMVPTQLEHGSYVALFSGGARVSTEVIFFRGIVEVDGHEFPVSFRVPNDYPEIPLNGEEEEEDVEINAEQSEDHEEIELEEHEARPQHELAEGYEAEGKFEISIKPVLAPIPTEKTWIKIHGLVNSFNEQPAFGLLKAHAKLGEWAKVRAFWTKTNLALNLEDSAENGNDHPNIGFTFSFYAAILVNATVVDVNIPDSNLYISGYWNVYNVTWTHRDGRDFTYTFESMAENKTGEFKVIDNMTQFTLEITDVGSVNGRVVFFLYRSFTIPRGDVNHDYIVNIWDLVHVARRYGATPGKPDFEFDLDLDDDFDIGLGELTTVAANLGTEY